MQLFTELVKSTMQEVASTHALALLLSTVGLAGVAFVLCTLRVSRPLPALTRGMLLISLLLFLTSLAFAPVLVLAVLSCASVAMLLVVDELLMVRNQRRHSAE